MNPQELEPELLTGLTVAEYFRDQEGQDVLFFVDNIFRFTQAGSEVSAFLGRIPSVVANNPLWQQIWVIYKRELQQQIRDQLLLYKQFMFQQTI